LPGVIDIAPAYASVALRYRPEVWATPARTAFAAIAEALRPLLIDTAQAAVVQRTVVIPVCYGGVHGVDLDLAAQRCGLTAQAFTALHADGDYSVAMLGFAPGFPYLLGLPAALHLPRRAEPRVRVPTGSVAIGGAQTGIYPTALPGGWHLIGRTPLVLFDAEATSPCLLAPGDNVRFYPITTAQFNTWPQAHPT
jgi:KipI family sensor histidine kinase inhibitor